LGVEKTPEISLWGLELGGDFPYKEILPDCGIQKRIRFLIIETDISIDRIGRVAWDGELGHFQAVKLLTDIDDFVGLGG
jgi:hypothetical protein